MLIKSYAEHLSYLHLKNSCNPKYLKEMLYEYAEHSDAICLMIAQNIYTPDECFLTLLTHNSFLIREEAVKNWKKRRKANIKVNVNDQITFSKKVEFWFKYLVGVFR